MSVTSVVDRLIEHCSRIGIEQQGREPARGPVRGFHLPDLDVAALFAALDAFVRTVWPYVSVLASTSAVGYYAYNVLKNPNGELVKTLGEVRQRQADLAQDLSQITANIDPDKRGPELARQVSQEVSDKVKEILLKNGRSEDRAKELAEPIAQTLATLVTESAETAGSGGPDPQSES